MKILHFLTLKFLLVFTAVLVLTPIEQARAATPSVVTNKSLVFSGSANITITGANGQNWTATDKITNRRVASGQVAGGKFTVNAPVGSYQIAVGDLSFAIAIIGATPAKDAFFGVNAHLGGQTNMGPLAMDLKRLGFGSQRFEVFWHSVERTKGKLAVPQWDLHASQAIDEARQDRLLLATYSNTLYTTGVHTPPRTAESRAAHERYLRFLLDEFPQAKAMQIWNEYNGPWWNSTNCRDGACYRADFGQTAAKISKDYPNVSLVINPVGTGDGHFVRQVLDDPNRDAARAWDDISYHTYATPTLSGLGAAATRMATDANNPGRTWRASNRPMNAYVSEFGHSVVAANAYPEGNSDRVQNELAQAERTVTDYLTYSAQRPFVKGAFIYQAVDACTDRREVECGFGLFSRPTSRVLAAQPKPAAVAIWVMRSQLTGWKHESTTLSSGSVWRSTYSKGSQIKTAIWSDAPQTYATLQRSHQRKVTLSAGVNPIANAYGAPGPIPNPENRQLTVDTMPVYLLETKPS